MVPTRMKTPIVSRKALSESTITPPMMVGSITRKSGNAQTIVTTKNLKPRTRSPLHSSHSGNGNCSPSRIFCTRRTQYPMRMMAGMISGESNATPVPIASFSFHRGSSVIKLSALTKSMVNLLIRRNYVAASPAGNVSGSCYPVVRAEQGSLSSSNTYFHARSFWQQLPRTDDPAPAGGRPHAVPCKASRISSATRSSASVASTRDSNSGIRSTGAAACTRPNAHAA